MPKARNGNDHGARVAAKGKRERRQLRALVLIQRAALAEAKLTLLVAAGTLRSLGHGEVADLLAAKAVQIATLGRVSAADAQRLIETQCAQQARRILTPEEALTTPPRIIG